MLWTWTLDLQHAAPSLSSARVERAGEVDASKPAGSSRPLTLSAEAKTNQVNPADLSTRRSFFRVKSAAREQTVGGREPVDGRANNWGSSCLAHV